MDFRVFVEPQSGSTYAEQLAAAQAAERAGFAGFFRSDHLMAVSGDGLPGPTESWVTLAGIARETSSIRLGTLVSNSNFRHPALLAITVAQVDAMSGGRVELGLGAGWFDREHTAYGFPFRAAAERSRRLEEQLEVVTGLWTTPVGSSFSYHGDSYQLDGAPALPKPAQQRLPIIVGGLGERRTPLLAARFADEFNTNFTSVERTAEAYGRVRAACDRIGRDPDSLTWSVSETVVTGLSDAEIEHRGGLMGPQHHDFVRRELYGSPDRVLELIAAYQKIGVQRMYLQFMDIRDVDYIEFVAANIVSYLS